MLDCLRRFEVKDWRVQYYDAAACVSCSLGIFLQRPNHSAFIDFPLKSYKNVTRQFKNLELWQYSHC